MGFASQQKIEGAGIGVHPCGVVLFNGAEFIEPLRIATLSGELHARNMSGIPVDNDLEVERAVSCMDFCDDVMLGRSPAPIEPAFTVYGKVEGVPFEVPEFNGETFRHNHTWLVDESGWVYDPRMLVLMPSGVYSEWIGPTHEIYLELPLQVVERYRGYERGDFECQELLNKKLFCP